MIFEVWAYRVNIFAVNRDKRPSRKTLSNSRIYVTLRFYKAPEIWASPIHKHFPQQEARLHFLYSAMILHFLCEVKTLDWVAPEMCCDPVNLAAPVFPPERHQMNGLGGRACKFQRHVAQSTLHIAKNILQVFFHWASP